MKKLEKLMPSKSSKNRMSKRLRLSTRLLLNKSLMNRKTKRLKMKTKTRRELEKMVALAKAEKLEKRAPQPKVAQVVRPTLGRELKEVKLALVVKENKLQRHLRRG